MTTPYFVPNRALVRELGLAAGRGVDVKMVLPGPSGMPLTRWAAGASYAKLLTAGVRIFEYRPRVLHAKTAVFDSEWSIVGSPNLDHLSLFSNYELTLVARDPALARRLTECFEQDLDDCSEVTLKWWNVRPWFHHVREIVGWRMRQWL